jgi:hypothetical protein
MPSSSASRKPRSNTLCRPFDTRQASIVFGVYAHSIMRGLTKTDELT